MTNQKCEFKTDNELGISFEQWEALIKTLYYLENNKLKHHKFIKNEHGGMESGLVSHHNLYPPTIPKRFNMAFWNSGEQECGTVCCIGGTAEALSGVNFSVVPDQLENLFYPYMLNNWHRITPKQAAKALRHYLTTGETDWVKFAPKKCFEREEDTDA